MKNSCGYNEENIVKKLSGFGIASDDIIASVTTDLAEPSSFGATVLCVLKDSLCVVGEDGSFFLKRYNDFEDIYAESYVSSGALIIRSSGEEIPIAYFSFKVSSEVEWFISVVRKLLNGEEYIPEKAEMRNSNDFSYINNGRKKLFFRVLSYIPRYKSKLILMLLIITFSITVNAIPPYLSGKILYDEVLTNTGRFAGRITELVAVLVLLSFLSVILSILLGRVGAELSGNVIYDIKTEVFSSMQKLGMSFFSSKRTGNLLNRINRDALDIQYFLNDGLPGFIINTVTICVIGLFLFLVNPLLSVAVLIPVPVIALIIKKSARVFKKLKWHTWRKSSAMNSVINDTFLGVRVVKAFGREQSEIERFSAASNSLCENRIREGTASARVFPVLSWIMALGGIIVWGIGGSRVVAGKLSFGALMSFVGYLSLLYSPVNFMVKTFDWWTACMSSAQRIFEVIDRNTDVPEAENPVEIERCRGDIELKNVTFSYEPNRPVLKNVSFSIKQGEMIGLVGHSGAGKSTITNIITRLYDVDDGEVLIDGVNVKEISFNTMRSNIGMVLQDTFLFSGSIAHNIAYGKPDASIEEIIDSAKKAHAHEFIINLPDGYDTLIGVGGIDLSGGEKQRISIARAILMNPAILIFDEATSSLDTKTEQRVQEAMENLTKGRTTIAIAHRFSTLKNADRLIVIENGCVVETGTHDELFNKPEGIYSKMAHLQLSALNLEKEGEEIW